MKIKASNHVDNENQIQFKHKQNILICRTCTLPYWVIHLKVSIMLENKMTPYWAKNRFYSTSFTNTGIKDEDEGQFAAYYFAHGL